MLVICDGVGVAYKQCPFTPYLSLGVFLSRLVALGSPMVSPGGDPIVLFFPSPAWGGGEPPTRGDTLVFVPVVR